MRLYNVSEANGIVYLNSIDNVPLISAKVELYITVGDGRMIL
jgi:hypothetical protein